MAAKERDALNLTGETAVGLKEEKEDPSCQHLSGNLKSDNSDGNRKVSDNSQDFEASSSVREPLHINIIRQNYVELIEKLEPQLFVHHLAPYLRNGIEEDMRKKEKSRALLDLLMRPGSPKSHFDQFCEVIAGLHPAIFKLLKKRKPTKIESESYLKPFSDRLREDILRTGSKIYNDVDKRIDLDTQFVSLKLSDVSVQVEHPSQKQNFGTQLENEDNLVPNYYQNVQQRHEKDLDVKDILPQQPAGKNILITGRAGIGKSTLIQFLNRQWAKEQWAGSHTAVFLLNLRKLADISRVLSLSQLLGKYAEYVPDPQNIPSPAVQWLEGNQEKVLLFTDGVDELADLSRLLRDTPKLTSDMEATPLEWCINLIRRNILPGSTLLMISRPFKGLQKLKRNVQIDVLGLVPEKVMQFVELNVQKTRQGIVKETLQKNPFLLSICCIPFYCAKICQILEEDENIDIDELTTYTRIMSFIISRLAARRMKEEEASLVLSDELSKCLPHMAALAYKGLSDSTDKVMRLVFREIDLTDTRFSQEEIRQARNTGLLVCSYVKDPLNEKMTETLEAEFLHLSIQELLAAAQMLKTDAQTVQNYLTNVTNCGSLNMSQLFLFGLALDKENKYITAINQGVMTETESRLHHDQQEKIEFSLLKHFENLCGKKKYTFTEILQMLQTAYESQRPNIASMVGSIVAPGGVLNLKSLHLTAVDMRALLFVLQHSSIQQIAFQNINIDGASAWEIKKHLSKCNEIKSLCLNNCYLDDQAMEHVFDAVKTTKSLNHLQFSSEKVSSEGMKYIADAVVTNTSLSILQLAKKVFTDEDIELLCPAIKTSLRHLQLSSDRIPPEAMTILGNAVTASSSLSNLELIIDQIPANGMKHIADSIQQSSALIHLHLANHMITAKAMKNLSSAIKANKNLRILHLEKNKIPAAGIQDLLDAVGYSTSLLRLQLEKLGLTDESMEHLSRAIQTTTSLRQLTLVENQITEEGMGHLSSSAKVAKCLNNLLLVNNTITSNGMKCLSEAIKYSSTLHHLQLSNNQIGDEGFQHLSNALASTISLTHLIIENNQISNEGMKQLSAALTSTKSVKNVVLRNNNIHDEGMEHLTDAIMTSGSLSHLEVSYNNITDERFKRLVEDKRRSSRVVNINFTRQKTNISAQDIQTSSTETRDIPLNILQVDIIHPQSIQIKISAKLTVASSVQ